MEQTEGSFAGIGVVMGMDNEQKFIQSASWKFSRAKAGLQEGDEILAVDGVPVTQIAFDEVAAHVRGQAGTDVVLTIMRDNANQDITITRDNIKLKLSVIKCQITISVIFKQYLSLKTLPMNLMKLTMI